MTEINLSIVNTLSNLIKCQHIRAVAFLPTEPYEEEFDDKDFEMAVHILATHENTPVACMRLNYESPNDGGTIHWGRLAITPTLESKLKVMALTRIAKYVDDYTIKMGFRKATGEVADKKLLKFWEKRGFQLTGEKPIVFGSRFFYKVEKVFEPLLDNSRNRYLHANNARSH